VLARYPEPRISLWDSFRDYFEHLLLLSPYFNDRIGIRIGFHITGDGGGDWSVDFRQESRGVRPTLADCGYEYRVAGRWALPLFTRELAWEDFLLSLRLTARRSADKCNDHVRLLRFADETLLRAVERRETTARADDRIVVRAGGNVCEVQRFCPHAGNDLLDSGEVLPHGALRCLAHRYEYSLTDGACLNGDAGRLRVSAAAAEQSAPTPLMSMPELPS
jgi:UDP-MurNAc hydroxylase